MASIVYGGVGGGGALFKGMKFFILQRVPMRSRWIELIKSNGGEVEKFEKNAEIMIADGARKDTPPGAVSWKFIDESAKAGRLVDIEEYRCGLPVGAAGANRARASATAQPGKSTRTPFTAADDRLLTKWVLKADRKGLSTKGNRIYMELEAQYPHHTYQSWLDRWKRHLLPRYNAGNLHYETEDGDSPSPERKPNPVKRGPAKPSTAQSSRDRVQAGSPKERDPVTGSSPPPKKSSSRRPSRPPLSKSPSPGVRIPKPVRGRPFTEDDDSILRSSFKQICEVDSDKEIESWEKWTEIYGSHSAQEWRNYFNAEFLPREMKAREKKKQEKIKSELSAANRQRSSPAVDKHTQKAQPAMPMKHSTYKAENSSIEKPIKSPIAPSKPKTSEAMSLKIDLEKRPYTSSLLKDEEYFKHILKDFSESLGFKPGDLNFFPEIRGKEISLFKLWQTVMLFGGFEKTNAKNRWQEVAGKLDFPTANRSKAAEDLNNCYDEILSELETLIVDAKNDEDNPEFSASQEETLMASHLEDRISRGIPKSPGHEETTENSDEVLELPSLSKSKQQSSISNKKRIISSDEFSSRNGSAVTQVKPQSKRQKMDKGKGKEMEIPSTPEHVFNATQPPASHHISPLKYHLDASDDDSSSHRQARETIRHTQQSKPEGSSRKASLKAPMNEPETQDFHHPEIDDEVSIASPTPAPKKMTPGLIIDLSKDSSSELELDLEPQPKLKSNPKSNPNPKTALESKSKSNTTAEPELEPESNAQDSVEDEIDKFKALGYSEEIIVAALDATTMDYEIASVVMEKLKMGHSIPDDMAGVWTKRDDDALFLKEGWAGYKRVRAKHGEERVTARKEFKG